MKRARQGQPTDLYLRLVRDESEKMVRLNRVVEFFIRTFGEGWKLVLERRGVISEDSTCRWIYRQQIPRWSTLNMLEDYAAQIGFVPAPRKGRQARTKPRRSVAATAPETAQDRALRALGGEIPALENRDIARPQVPHFPCDPPISSIPVSISPTTSSLNKDQAVQLDFLSALSPNDLPK